MALAVTERIFSLAVHLPQFVRCRALETIRRWAMRVFADQAVTLQNPVNGPHRQSDLLFLVQQHSQFLRAPTRLLTQCDHSLLFPGFGAARTAMRLSAALADLCQAAGLPVALAPEITRWPRNLKLAAQRRHAFLAAAGSNHELHPLLVHIHPFPRHRLRPPRPKTLPQL